MWRPTLVVLLLACSRPVDYRPEGDDYRVRFPKQPEVDTEQLKSGLTLTRAEAQLSATERYSVTAYDGIPGPTDMLLGERLERTCHAAAQGSKSRLVRADLILAEKDRGHLECVVAFDAAGVAIDSTNHVVMLGGRMYIVGVMRPAGAPPSDTASAFLRSFEVGGWRPVH